MHKKLLKLLPWLALVFGILFIISITQLRHEQRDENLENRIKAINVIERIQAIHPANISDSAFISEIEDALKSPYIGTVWLITPDGEIVFAKGGTAASTGINVSVQELAPFWFHEILNSVPEDALNPYQRTLLFTAYTIQREGEHNDIYNHLVREIHSNDGSLVGLIGINYPLSSDPSGRVSLMVILSGLVAAISFVIYWGSLPLWVFFDARRREERAVVWAIFVFIGNLIALIAYLLTKLPIREPSIDK